MHNGDSLSFKILKSRYFPNKSLMKSLKKANSSYLWNSMMECKKIIENGAVWRVGDGRQIDT